jgi:outer membrane lipoprotein-sorting protein
MSLLSSRPALRWAVPVGVLAAALAAGGVGSVLSANAEPPLPKRSAAELLVDLQNSRVEHFSGTIVQKSDLGLPALPQAGSQGSSNLTSLVSGVHTLRVWYAGPEKVRFALLGTLGESDVIRNGQDLWKWSSDERSATHYTIPGKAGEHPRPPQQPITPKDAADQVLKAIDPSTKVTTDGTAKVAGRSAYELVLEPRDTASRIGQVRFALDAKQHVPLQVQVFAKGSGTPSFEVRFEQISFAKPSDEQFTFTAPKGTTVTEGKLFGAMPTAPHLPKPPASPDDVPGGPTVIGKGWSSVMVFHGAKMPAIVPEREVGHGDNPLGPVLAAMPKVSGPWGSGTLLKTKLFSALLTDDGRLLAGAVSPEQLYAAAADPAAKAPR